MLRFALTIALAFSIYPKTAVKAHAEGYVCMSSLSFLRQHDQYVEVLVDERKDILAGIKITWYLWANKETGSWTLTISDDTDTCVVKSGMSGYADWTLDNFLKDDLI